MLITSFLIGALIGLLVALPVGPIAVLCMRRSITDGFLIGVVSGIGAACADAVYGALAAFGLSFVYDFLLNHSLFIRLMGGIYLIYLGSIIFISRPFKSPETYKKPSLITALTTTFFLTLSNPLTIGAFLAFLTMYHIRELTIGSALLVVGGIFTGSCLWWLILASGSSFLKTRFTTQTLAWINKASGIIIICFGLFSILTIAIVQ